MGTGIFKHSVLGREELSQVDLEYWCRQCQFPYIDGGCKEKADIQRCWDLSQANGHRWHLLNECPFQHQGQPCQCNDYKGMPAAFAAAGLTYRK